MGENEEATAPNPVLASQDNRQPDRTAPRPIRELRRGQRTGGVCQRGECGECAVEIQTTLKTENASLPSERQMEFRIGVNLGDVMVEGEQIYGDGVNVAARLESLAEPGGICISGKVHEEIQNKLALSCEDLGEQQVKNIAKPVRVFRVLPRASAVATTRKTRKSSEKILCGGALSRWRVWRLSLRQSCSVQHVSLKPPHTSASIPPAQKSGAAAARQTLDRRVALHQHERGSRAGIFQRRHHR